MMSLWELVFFLDGHVHEVLVISPEHIDVDVAFDAVNLAYISMLPECPFTLVFERINIIVGYPVGVTVKLGCVEVGGAELVTCIENGGDPVMFFHYVHPTEHFSLQLCGAVTACFLYVEHGRQVVFFELHHFAEELGLCLARG